jgi:hypothetical protein
VERNHQFVDEYKQLRYLLVAVAVPTVSLASARRALRELVLPRQRRIHFRKERDSRRHVILDVVTGLDVRATVYDASSYTSQILGRAACLAALVADLAESNTERLVLETDDAAVGTDRALLYELVRKHDLGGTLRYHHMRAHEENLLSIPDALAWCWGRGGQWRARVSRLVTDMRRL